MEIRAELNHLRIAPRKVRAVADAIRGKRVSEAAPILRLLMRRASGPLAKLLAAAVSDARQNFRVAAPDALMIKRILVDGGPTLKRSRPRAFGRAFPIKKRTSHVTLILEGQVPAAPSRRRALPTVVGDDQAVSPSDRSKTTAPRPETHMRPKVDTKPTGFVRRMFRRKAI